MEQQATFVKNIERIKELHKKGCELFKNYDGVLYQYATGVGKSKQAIDILDEYFKTDSKPWCLVYYETSHKQNWIDEFEKWNKGDLLDKIQFVTYASFVKLMSKEPHSNFIFDEAHHMMSPTVYPVMLQLIKKGIFLTATMSFEYLSILKNDFKNYGFLFKSVKYDLTTAIAEKVLPEPKIWTVWSELNNTRRDQYIEITRGPKVKLDKMPEVICDFGQHFGYLKGKQPVKLKIRCSMYEKVNYYEEQVTYNRNVFYANKQFWAKNKWILSGSVRKRVIGEAKSKTVKMLAEKLKDKRGVFFCTSINQIKELSDGTNCIHSKQTAKKNEEILSNYQNGLINHLYVNQKLIEGMNLENIDFVVIVQLDKKELKFIQKIGRAMRAVVPEVFILLLANTEDQVFWKKNLPAIPKESLSDFMER